LIKMVQNLPQVLLLLLLPCQLWAQPSPECPRVTKEHTNCLDRAYKSYKAAVEAGDDGEPHFHARKACDYLKSAVEDCGNMLVGACYTEAEVRRQKDEQFRGIVSQMEKTVQGWDSRSCPIIREYLERQAKAEAFKAGEEEIEEAIEAVENAGEKLKATAEGAKKSMEEGVGSNGDAGLLPTVYLVMLLPKLMM